MNTKDVAVLAAGQLYRVVDGAWSTIQIDIDTSSSINLCNLCVEKSITSLWVLDDVDADQEYFTGSKVGYNMLPNFNYPLHKRPPLRRKHQLVSMSGYKYGGGQKQFSILFPKNSKAPWRFLKDSQPHHILLTVLYLRKELQVNITASAGTVGMSLLKRFNGDHPQWLDVPKWDSEDLPEPTFRWRDVAADVIWSRRPNPQEQTFKYLHKLDKNSAYLRSAVANKFGVSNPIHVTAADENEKRPGVWQVVYEPRDIPGLPLPWDNDGADWVTTPILDLLRKTGHGVKVEQGYVWPESHQVFKRWGEKLWEVRELFRKRDGYKNDIVCDMAADAIKQIYTSAIGLSSYGGFEDGEESYKNRPDWKMMVVGHARATMFYNMIKMENERGVTPVLVYMDALYFLSDEPDPFIACAPLLDRKKLRSLGGYKHEWTINDPEVLEVLNNDNLVESQKLELFNQLARGGVTNVNV